MTQKKYTQYKWEHTNDISMAEKKIRKNMCGAQMNEKKSKNAIFILFKINRKWKNNGQLCAKPQTQKGK